MLKASIDIGSNSVILSVLDIESNGHFKEVESHLRITSLGKDIDKTKVFNIDSKKETLDALSFFCDVIKKYNIKINEVVVTATEASRVALDAKDFYKRIYKDLGLITRIINGNGEAHFAAYGAIQSLINTQDNLFVLDIGGASTELIIVKSRPFEIVSSISFPIGSVRATDWINDGTYQAKMELAIPRSKMAQFQFKKAICIAGTWTSIASMFFNQTKYDPSLIHNKTFKTAELKNLALSMLSLNQEQIIQKYPFLGKRSKTIKGGLRFALDLVEGLGLDELSISDHGLRHGTALLSEKISEFEIWSADQN